MARVGGESERGPAGKPAQRFARWLLTQPRASHPEKTCCIRVTGTDWKELMRSRLFAGLGMNADFGLPAPRTNQPSGHYETKKGVEIQSLDDATPPVLQPAGDVQLSILDYAKFLQFHLRGLAGTDGVLKASTVKVMHTPAGKAGLGWGVREFDGVLASVHSGSAGSYYAVTILTPSRNLGVAVFVNSGGERATAACSEAAKKFLAQFKTASR